MTSTLTGFGGIGEIGGNAFLVDDGKTRILLDFGKRFGNDTMVEEQGLRPGWGDYWDEFLNPRTFSMVPDLQALGLLPPVPGVYRQDLGGAPGEGVDAIFVTHAHMDHAGLLGLVRPEIPVHLTPDSKAILESIQATGMSKAENDLVHVAPRGLAGFLTKGDLSPRPPYKWRTPRNYQTATKTDAGGWSAEFYPVDHSIHGAAAVVLTGPSLSLAYTGDFRLHGRNGNRTEAFVKKAKGVDYLLTEGTRVRRPKDREATIPVTDKEIEVEAEIAGYVEKENARPNRSGFVTIAYPPRDLDRFVSVYNAARRVGRRLTIPTKLAHLLEQMRAAGRDDLPDPRQDPGLAVHVRPKEKGSIRYYPKGPLPVMRPDGSVDTVAPTPEAFDALLAREYDDWEYEYIQTKNFVTGADIAREPSGFLVTMNYWAITDLFDCFPNPSHADGLYIHSATQPFNDDMEQNDRKLMRWLKRFNMSRQDTHVSGHLGPDDLDWVLDEIQPRVLIPVHTLADQYTAQRYETRLKGKATVPVYGKPIEL